MQTTIETTADPSAENLAFVEQSLTTFNDADVGVSAKTALAVFVRVADSTIVAAISAYTAWGWLYIQWLWVDESFRGQNIAGKMLDAAEKEAGIRGCHGSLIDTFSPTAEKTYKRHGYKTFATLDDFPIGRQRVYLQKKLTPN